MWKMLLGGSPFSGKVTIAVYVVSSQGFVHVLISLCAQGPPDHPAIKALLIDFFYGGHGCLAAAFPDEFSHTVPKCALALAMTCVSIFFTSLNMLLTTTIRFKTVWKSISPGLR
jgi:hypothetical protein